MRTDSSEQQGENKQTFSCKKFEQKYHAVVGMKNEKNNVNLPPEFVFGRENKKKKKYSIPCGSPVHARYFFFFASNTHYCNNNGLQITQRKLNVAIRKFRTFWISLFLLCLIYLFFLKSVGGYTVDRYYNRFRSWVHEKMRFFLPECIHFVEPEFGLGIKRGYNKIIISWIFVHFDEFQTRIIVVERTRQFLFG